jgi:hypothetical protein
LLKDRARMHPFAGNGGSWRRAAVREQFRPTRRQSELFSSSLSSLIEFGHASSHTVGESEKSLDTLHPFVRRIVIA